MALDVREMVADAERLAEPFVARPVNMQFCAVHRDQAYEENFAGLLVCPHRSHWPDRGDGDE